MGKYRTARHAIECGQYFALVCIVLALCACAQPGANKPSDIAGWRKGWVSRVADGKDLKNIAVRECVAPLPADEILRRRFAVVAYGEGRVQRHRTVTIPDNLVVAQGDKVWINIGDCALPISKIDP